MWVNLDQIEFYHGPSNQPPSAREKQPPTYDTQFQCSLPTMPDFVQEPTNIPEYPTPLAQESSSTGMTHAWNSFDIEMSDFCNIAAPQSQMTTEMEPVVTADLSSILDTPLGLASYPLSFSEPAVFVDSATTTPSTTQQLDHIPVHVQKISSSNALPDVKDAGTPLLLSASCETASEQASNASRRMSTCDDSQQEPALPHTGTRHLSFADPGRRDEDTACELHHALHPGENPSSRATDVPERTEDAQVALVAELYQRLHGSKEESLGQAQGLPRQRAKNGFVRVTLAVATTGVRM
ncbi:hypothetical protein EYZ11_010443 [Aspergillus tanneri]|uniref:Uncharacterized protein n=1 Tax=Aspergillus tanneri TaxID=1220188 RepID=A0A4S3J5M9_9EURO|nr:hypothetical protein EYZ11_010443 [Aspergillus tanneri]